MLPPPPPRPAGHAAGRGQPAVRAAVLPAPQRLGAWGPAGAGGVPWARSRLGWCARPCGQRHPAGGLGVWQGGLLQHQACVVLCRECGEALPALGQQVPQSALRCCCCACTQLPRARPAPQFVLEVLQQRLLRKSGNNRASITTGAGGAAMVVLRASRWVCGRQVAGARTGRRLTRQACGRSCRQPPPPAPPPARTLLPPTVPRPSAHLHAAAADRAQPPSTPPA